MTVNIENRCFRPKLRVRNKNDMIVPETGFQRVAHCQLLKHGDTPFRVCNEDNIIGKIVLDGRNRRVINDGIEVSVALLQFPIRQPPYIFFTITWDPEILVGRGFQGCLGRRRS